MCKPLSDERLDDIIRSGLLLPDMAVMPDAELDRLTVDTIAGLEELQRYRAGEIAPPGTRNVPEAELRALIRQVGVPMNPVDRDGMQTNWQAHFGLDPQAPEVKT